MRDFNTWLQSFKEVIAGYKYYTDFEKIYRNVDGIKVQLCLMNSLIGSPDIEKDFQELYAQYPEILRCIPILLAKRESEILIYDTAGEHRFNFKKPNYTATQYAVFMRETGLFELIGNKHITNLIDYVTGVETGLDSNARKNRGGDTMEDLVETYIQKAGLIKGRDYFKEMHIHDIQDRWHIDLSCISNEGGTEKRFDFVIKRPLMIYTASRPTSTPAPAPNSTKQPAATRPSPSKPKTWTTSASSGSPTAKAGSLPRTT